MAGRVAADEELLRGDGEDPLHEPPRVVPRIPRDEKVADARREARVDELIAIA